MKLKGCIAGPVRCKFKANADKHIVCSSPLGQVTLAGKIYLAPLDSKGGYCPFFENVEVNKLGLEEVIPE